MTVDSGLDDVLRQRLLARRAQVGEWFNRFRVGATLLWLLVAYFFRWHVRLEVVGAYLLLSVLLWAGSRRVRVLSRLPELGILVIDMPSIFGVQWFAIPQATSPEAAALLVIGGYITLVVVVALLVRSVWAVAGATGLAIALEAGLMLRAGLRLEDHGPALALVVAVAAMAAAWASTAR